MRDYGHLITLTSFRYQEWLTKQQSDFLLDDDINLLYSIHSIPERNETNEMDVYLPDYLLIGDDSGDMVFVIECEKESPIWKVEAGSLRKEDFELISTSFSTWMNSGFALTQPLEYHLPLQAVIYINNVADLKTMFSINRFLVTNWSASQMKLLLNEQPIMVTESGAPIALENRLKENPEFEPYIYYKNGGSLSKISS